MKTTQTLCLALLFPALVIAGCVSKQLSVAMPGPVVDVSSAHRVERRVALVQDASDLQKIRMRKFVTASETKKPIPASFNFEVVLQPGLDSMVRNSLTVIFSEVVLISSSSDTKSYDLALLSNYLLREDQASSVMSWEFLDAKTGKRVARYTSDHPMNYAPAGPKKTAGLIDAQDNLNKFAKCISLDVAEHLKSLMQQVSREAGQKF